MEILLETFDAEDASGTVYTLHIYQQMINASSLSSPGRRIPGRKRIVSSRGEEVSFIDDRTFMLVNSGEKLFRVS